MRQKHRMDVVGAWARWTSDKIRHPEPTMKEKWTASRLHDAEYERYAVGRVEAMVAPVRDAAIGLLVEIGKEPNDTTLCAFADWLQTEMGQTPVELHEYPPWMLNHHRKRQFEGLEMSDWDHWGRTVLFGLEVLVTEPYRDPAWAIQACKTKTAWNGVPFFSEASWNSGCIRVGWFDRTQLIKELGNCWIQPEAAEQSVTV